MRARAERARETEPRETKAYMCLALQHRKRESKIVWRAANVLHSNPDNTQSKNEAHALVIRHRAGFAIWFFLIRPKQKVELSPP